jgi:deoxyribodipyrimidine photo-lyase
MVAKQETVVTWMEGSVPKVRVRVCNEGSVRTGGQYVLYWMIANRRTGWNFSLQRAVDWCRHVNRPLLVLEALRVDYPWASDRLHQFVIEGMAENQSRLEKAGVAYYPYVEPRVGAGRGLLGELAKQACVVVTDDFPCFFLPRIVDAAANQLACRLEAVDSNGLLPMRAAEQVYTLAHSFRRFLQKQLPQHLTAFPAADPLRRDALSRGTLQDLVAASVLRRWPMSAVDDGAADRSAAANLPVDHRVAVAATRGGSKQAERRLARFIAQSLDGYGERRNHPDEEGASGLSPYLHFGHLSAHQIFHDVMRSDEWTIDAIAPKPNGSREGWWGASPAVESFLDELITWRELGYNMCSQRTDYDQFDSLPDWALATLDKHRRDPRPHLYSLEEFEASQTHDRLWNAAQRQLVREGRIHNYLRMLWGKKILHWTHRPQEALEIMIELNNKYALDGRNPNSYSGIFWVLGRYDRAWGPERPVFGKIRYMTSDNTARKVRLREYLKRFGEDD